jgi:hypothetical protein
VRNPAWPTMCKRAHAVPIGANPERSTQIASFTDKVDTDSLLEVFRLGNVMRPRSGPLLVLGLRRLAGADRRLRTAALYRVYYRRELSGPLRPRLACPPIPAVMARLLN